MKRDYKISIFFVSFSIIFLFLNFLRIIYWDMPGNDSSFYILIGDYLRDGKKIYVDVFDNKGPIIFFLNFIGSMITYKSLIGTNLVELICFIFLIVFLFKNIKLEKVEKNYLIGIFIFSYFFQYYDGNLSTTWFIVFATPIYIIFYNFIFNKNYLSKSEKFLFSFFLGISTTIILLIKYVYASGLILISFIYLYENRKYLFSLLFFYLTGVFAVTFFTYTFFYYPDLVKYFLSDYLLFNYYVGFDNRYDENIILDILKHVFVNLKGKFIFNFYKQLPIIFSIYIFIIICFEKKYNILQNLKTKNFLYIFLIVSADLFVLLMIPMYSASYLFILPSFIILQLFLINFLKEKKNYKKFNTSHIILILLATFLFNKNIFNYSYNKHDVNFLNNLNTHVENASDKTALALGTYTTGSIWFVKTNLRSISRYHYTPPVNYEKYLNKIYSEYFELIKNQEPNYILFNPYFYGGYLDDEQNIFQNSSLQKINLLIKKLNYEEIFLNKKNLKMFKNTKVFYLNK